MKILYIAPDITDSGGISRVVSLKANYLVSCMDYEISILSVNDCSAKRFYDFNPKIKWFNIKETENKSLFLRKYIRFIKNAISQEKPDIIVVCDAVLWLFIPWFVKTKIPMVFETHFSIQYKKSKNENIYSKLRFGLVRFFKQKSIDKFSCFVTITNEEKKEIKSKKGIVIPNPLSFTVNAKSALINKKAMAVCMNPYVKGLDRLLTIWSKIIENHPDWTLDIYGNWDENCAYIEIADNLKVSNNINFLPPTTDIQNSYNQSSIFLMTSRTEAFGMVLIEAMASGVPCIAYDCPSGPRAIIKNGENGFLIEDENQDSYIQKLKLLIEDEKLRIKMGAKAQQTVKKYEIEGVMKKWETLFLSLIK